MKNLLKLAISLVMVLTIAFGANIASASASVDLVCNVKAQGDSCVDVLEPSACLKVTDSVKAEYSLLQVSNFNADEDGHWDLKAGDLDLDYWIEPNTSMNFLFGDRQELKVCNTSDGYHEPLLLVKYPSFPDF